MKSAILITARLKSTRLPYKAVRPILGKPMIVHMLDRLKLSKFPEQIIICTSTESQDDPLVEIASKEEVAYFRGHPDDVLLRNTEAAALHGVQTVISCTADNPFVDPEYVDRLIDFHVKNANDFTKIEGLPWGTFSYALSYEAMVKACRIKATSETEVWGAYFTETGFFKCGILKVDEPALRWPDLRLTVDTQEDFKLVTTIFYELYDGERVFPLKEIIELCRRRRDLVEINASITQKAPPPIKIKPERKKSVPYSESF